MIAYHVWIKSSLERRRPALGWIEFAADGSILRILPIDAGRIVNTESKK